MFYFICRRLLMMAILLPCLSVVVFYVISLMPNPLDEKMASNPKMTARDKRRLEKQFNLDKPPILNFSVPDLPKNIQRHLVYLVPPTAPGAFPLQEELQALEKKSTEGELTPSENNRREELFEERAEHNRLVQKHNTFLGKQELAREELINWGQVCVPTLIAIRKEWQMELDRHLQNQGKEPSPYVEKLYHLNLLLKQLTSEEPKGDWMSWYEKHQEEFEPTFLRRTISQLKQSETQNQAIEQILKRDTVYLEFLIKELSEESPLPDETFILFLRLLTLLTADPKDRDTLQTKQKNFEKLQSGKALQGTRHFQIEDRKEAVHYWKEWWINNDSDYRKLSWSEKKIRIFTYTQYGIWLGRILKSLLAFQFLKPDFGNSHVYKEPVINKLIDTLKNTLWLTVFAFFLSILIALPLGIIAAVYQYKKIDYVINAFAFIGMSVPTFFSGLIAITIFSFYLGWLPSGGKYSPKIAHLNSWVDFARHLILPVCILAYYEIAMLIRYMRTSMLEVVGQDFIRTARAKGLDEDVVIFKHALRNALIPVITILATSMPFLFSGALVTETIFSWKGMGSLLYEAVIQKDSNVVMPAFMFLAFLTMSFNLIADVLYALVDPRIQHS